MPSPNPGLLEPKPNPVIAQALPKLCAILKPCTDELNLTLIVKIVPLPILGVVTTLKIGMMPTFTVDVPRVVDVSPLVDATLVNFYNYFVLLILNQDLVNAYCYLLNMLHKVIRTY